jgi:putative hemolysin
MGIIHPILRTLLLPREVINKSASLIELTFIRAEYRRKFGCLSLIWRGIGEFVYRNPRYRYLFGPVNISQSYHKFTRNLMVAFRKPGGAKPWLSGSEGG